MDLLFWSSPFKIALLVCEIHEDIRTKNVPKNCGFCILVLKWHVGNIFRTNRGKCGLMQETSPFKRALF